MPSSCSGESWRRSATPSAWTRPRPRWSPGSWRTWCAPPTATAPSSCRPASTRRRSPTLTQRCAPRRRSAAGSAAGAAASSGVARRARCPLRARARRALKRGPCRDDNWAVGVRHRPLNRSLMWSSATAAASRPRTARSTRSSSRRASAQTRCGGRGTPRRSTWRTGWRSSPTGRPRPWGGARAVPAGSKGHLRGGPRCGSPVPALLPARRFPGMPWVG